MEEKKTGNGYKYFVTIIITALITCILTTIVMYNYFYGKSGAQGMENQNFLSGFLKIFSKNTNNDTIESELANIKQKLESVYIGDMDEEKMKEGALEGYVAALGDEYTEYLTEEEVSSLMQEVKGSYVGVGVYIQQYTRTNQILVIGVIEDSPAAKAGILAGDVIKKIDDIEYNGQQLSQASEKMKGIEGTKVKITVERNNEEVEFEVFREKIKSKCVKSEKLDNNIGYIKISSFDGGCAEDFEKEYKNLESQGIQSLVIDLRNNGGGLVDQSLEIAEMIVPKGATMLITSDKTKKEESYTSQKNAIVKVPIVVLVNGYTASASEILTAAIKENTDAKVVGTQTYGKGIIQGVFLFDDQETGMKITIQEYYTPKHNKLHKIGITPDIVVELPQELRGYSSVDRKYDNQLDKAIELLK